MRWMHHLKRFVSTLPLILILIPVAFPLIWIVLLAFKNSREIVMDTIALPHNWAFRNFSDVLSQPSVYRALGISILVAVITMVLQVIISLFGSYCLTRFKFKGQKVILYILLSGIALPGFVLIAPIFMITRSLGLYDTAWGLVFPYITFGIASNMLIMTSYIRSMPISIEEASVIDGCNFWQMMFKVVIPQMKPVAIMVALSCFFASYNEYGLASYLMSSSDHRTVSLLAVELGGSGNSTDYGLFAAAIIILMLPEVVLFLVMQKHIVTNVTAGGIKG